MSHAKTAAETQRPNYYVTGCVERSAAQRRCRTANATAGGCHSTSLRRSHGARLAAQPGARARVADVSRRTAAPLLPHHGGRPGCHRVGAPRRAPRRAVAPPPRCSERLVPLGLQAFVQHYYTTFDNPATRASLASLYQPQSMLTFEGSKLQARAAAPRLVSRRVAHAAQAPARAACRAGKLFDACCAAAAARGRGGAACVQTRSAKARLRPNRLRLLALRRAGRRSWRSSPRCPSACASTRRATPRAAPRCAERCTRGASRCVALAVRSRARAAPGDHLRCAAVAQPGHHGVCVREPDRARPPAPLHAKRPAFKPLARGCAALSASSPPARQGKHAARCADVPALVRADGRRDAAVQVQPGVPPDAGGGVLVRLQRHVPPQLRVKQHRAAPLRARMPRGWARLPRRELRLRCRACATIRPLFARFITTLGPASRLLCPGVAPQSHSKHRSPCAASAGAACTREASAPAAAASSPRSARTRASRSNSSSSTTPSARIACASM